MSMEEKHQMNDRNETHYIFPINTTMLPFFMFPKLIPVIFLLVVSLVVAALFGVVLATGASAPDVDKWSPDVHHRAVQACEVTGDEIAERTEGSKMRIEKTKNKKQRMRAGTDTFGTKGLERMDKKITSNDTGRSMYEIFGFVASVQLGNSNDRYLYFCGVDMQQSQDGAELNLQNGNMYAELYKTDVALKEAEHFISEKYYTE